MRYAPVLTKTAASPVQPALSLVGQSVGMSQKFDFMDQTLFLNSLFTSSTPHSKPAVSFISEYTAMLFILISEGKISPVIFAYLKPNIEKCGLNSFLPLLQI